MVPEDLGVDPAGWRRSLLRTAALYFVIWCAATAPALRTAWWFLDDYGMADVFAPLNVEHHVEQGRPGQLLWMMTFFLDGDAERGTANVLLRLFQGGLHALAAALAAGLLAEATGRRGAWAAGLPFLLWPHSTEVVLWRSAGHYVAAAVLSLLAVLLWRRPGRRWGIVAGTLLVAAVLTHQLAAMAGFCVWCLRLTIAAVMDKLGRRERWLADAAVLAVGYGAGALASFAVAWIGPGDPFRLEPAHSLTARLGLLLDLNRRFFTDPVFYPPAVVALQLGALCLAAGSLLVAPGFRARYAAAGLAGALVAPYAALLPVAETYVSWRLFYLAPLVFSGAWVLAEAASAGRRWWRVLIFTVFGTLVASYVPTLWQAAAVFPRVYAEDRAFLREVEDRVRARETDAICVIGPDRLPPAHLNPFGLAFPRGGVKLSAWLGAARPFMGWFSWVEKLEGEEDLARCTTACSAGERGRFTFRELPPELICLCPP